MNRKQKFFSSPKGWGLMLVGFFIALQACKEQKALEPIVCPEANFRMEQEIVDTLVPVDTIFNNTIAVQFTASDLYETYEWKVGADDRTWTDKSFFLRFNEALGDIKITFIGKRKNIAGCEVAGEDEEIIDTLVRNLHVKNLPAPYFYPAPEPYLYQGTWRGAFTDEPENVFEIRIQDAGPAEGPNDSSWGLRLLNFPEGCANFEDPNDPRNSIQVGGASYRYFGLSSDMDSSIGCPWTLSYRTFGAVYGTKNDSLLIYINNFNPDKIFKAKKIK